MYSPLGKINDSILASLNEIDITDLYFEEMQSSLFSRLCKHETFEHHEDFRVQTNNNNVIVKTNRGLFAIVSSQTDAIFVPPMTIACYPTTKIASWRKNMNIDIWLRNGIKSILRSIDAELVDALIYAADHALAQRGQRHASNVGDTFDKTHKKHETNTILMSPSTYKHQFGVEIETYACQDTAYVIPKNGIVPITPCETEEMLRKDWVVEVQQGDMRILVTDIMPNHMIIEWSDVPLGIICSRNKVFAFPVPEPKKLRVGAVLSNECGICVYEASQYSHRYTSAGSS